MEEFLKRHSCKHGREQCRNPRHIEYYIDLQKLIASLGAEQLPEERTKPAGTPVNYLYGDVLKDP